MWASLTWVLLLLAAFGALAWWLRFRFGRETGPELLHIRAVRRLEAGQALWLVEVDGRRLLLGSGRDGVRLVADLTRDPP